MQNKSIVILAKYTYDRFIIVSCEVIIWQLL